MSLDKLKIEANEPKEVESTKGVLEIQAFVLGIWMLIGSIAMLVWY